MTYKRTLQAAMAAGISVAIGLGATACSRDYVADYVYTVSASSPNINAFAVDFQSGILTQVTGKLYDDTSGALSELPRGSTFTATGLAQCMAISGAVD